MCHMRHPPVRNVMKKTVKRKKKPSECCYHCPSGPPEPSLLPAANCSNHLTLLAAVQRHCLAAQGSGRNAGFFPLKAAFSLSEETQGVQKPGTFHIQRAWKIPAFCTPRAL